MWSLVLQTRKCADNPARYVQVAGKQPTEWITGHCSGLAKGRLVRLAERRCLAGQAKGRQQRQVVCCVGRTDCSEIRVTSVPDSQLGTSVQGVIVCEDFAIRPN